MAIVSINGVALPSPSGYDVGIADISNAERNANGFMLIERIATKKKLEIQYKFMTASELSSTLQKVAATSFSVTYLDPETNSYKTGSFYCGDRNVSLMDFIGGQPRYQGVTFNLIER